MTWLWTSLFTFFNYTYSLVWNSIFSKHFCLCITSDLIEFTVNDLMWAVSWKAPSEFKSIINKSQKYLIHRFWISVPENNEHKAEQEFNYEMLKRDIAVWNICNKYTNRFHRYIYHRIQQNRDGTSCTCLFINEYQPRFGGFYFYFVNTVCARKKKIEN